MFSAIGRTAVLVFISKCNPADHCCRENIAAGGEATGGAYSPRKTTFT
jgi:hypothetical protein